MAPEHFSCRKTSCILKCLLVMLRLSHCLTASRLMKPYKCVRYAWWGKCPCFPATVNPDLSVATFLFLSPHLGWFQILEIFFSELFPLTPTAICWFVLEGAGNKIRWEQSASGETVSSLPGLGFVHMNHLTLNFIYCSSWVLAFSLEMAVCMSGLLAFPFMVLIQSDWAAPKMSWVWEGCWVAHVGWTPWLKHACSVMLLKDGLYNQPWV